MGNLAHKSQYDKLYVIGTGLLSVKNLIKLSIPIGYTCINANKINEEDEWENARQVLPRSSKREECFQYSTTLTMNKFNHCKKQL